jgi:hypothetical protein
MKLCRLAVCCCHFGEACHSYFQVVKATFSSLIILCLSLSLCAVVYNCCMICLKRMHEFEIMSINLYGLTQELLDIL